MGTTVSDVVRAVARKEETESGEEDVELLITLGERRSANVAATLPPGTKQH